MDQLGSRQLVTPAPGGNELQVRREVRCHGPHRPERRRWTDGVKLPPRWTSLASLQSGHCMADVRGSGPKRSPSVNKIHNPL